jgi:para-nitrobenzyl esterase
MRNIFRRERSAAGMLMLFAGLWGAPAGAAPRAVTEAGTLQGAVADGVESFKGIAFAASPVGALRWRPPQPAPHWAGVREALDFGGDCMQLRQRPGNGQTTPSEDCLFVNVWRPAASSGARLPVLVWIYGGAFVAGGSSEPRQDGTPFAAQGLVFVSFNYRLGRFGFFGFPALTREHPDEAHGNYGFMDQIAALAWVRRNITAFGGDPRHVTVMGESAGGESLVALLAARQARGLFQQVILQSSGARTALTGIRSLSTDRPGLPSAESLGRNFAASLGIPGDGPEALARLRALPAAQIAAGVSSSALRDGSLDATYGGPLLDGRIVTQEPRAMYLAGRTPPVAVLCGATNADLGQVDAASKDALFERFGERRAAAVAAYDPQGDVPLSILKNTVGADQMMVEPARALAAAAAARGLTAYEYRFSYVAPARRAVWTNGAPHGSDVPFAFDSVSRGGDATAADIAVAHMVNRFFAQFARTGDPNGANLAHWPRYSAAGLLMNFTAAGEAVAGPDPWAPRLDVVRGADLGTKP